MSLIFNLDNPIWRFVGNLADMFILSVLWYLCCIPIFTLGSGTTAMYYVTLKMTSNQEGYTISSFFKFFKENFKNSTLIWLIFLACALILACDFYWSFFSNSLFAKAVFFTFLLVTVLYSLCLSFIFPLIARCDNSIKVLLSMCFVMSIRNFLPVLSTVLITVGFFAFGFFIFWPILLIAPGLTAYLNSYIFNHILNNYNFNLSNE